jgi:hypothetical protein
VFGVDSESSRSPMPGPREVIVIDPNENECKDGLLLTDKTRIHVQSASVRTYIFSPHGFPRFLWIRGAWWLHMFDLPLLTNLSKPQSTVKLENNYVTLERTIKPTRYVKDTCPRVYGTWTCNHITYENRSNLSGVVTTVSPFPSPRTVTMQRYSWLDLWWTRRVEWIQGSIEILLPSRHGS